MTRLNCLEFADVLTIGNKSESPIANFQFSWVQPDMFCMLVIFHDWNVQITILYGRSNDSLLCQPWRLKDCCLNSILPLLGVTHLHKPITQFINPSLMLHHSACFHFGRLVHANIYNCTYMRIIMCVYQYNLIYTYRTHYTRQYL